jgi:hypothetical protein
MNLKDLSNCREKGEKVVEQTPCREMFSMLSALE